MTTETKDPEVAEVPAAPEAPEPVAPSADESGHKGSFERLVLPVLLPIVIVGTVLFWVLNLSRILLATDGNGAVILGAGVTLVILVGAALFSAAPRLRSSSMGMIVSALCALLLLGGLVTISAAEDHEGGEEAAGGVTGPAVGVAEFVSGNLWFEPKEIDVPFDPNAAETIIQVNLTNDAGDHTYLFEDGAVRFEKLAVSGEGATDEGKAAFPAEGTYIFYCDVPGHRAGGMEGTMTVTSSVEPEAVEEAPAS